MSEGVILTQHAAERLAELFRAYNRTAPGGLSGGNQGRYSCHVRITTDNTDGTYQGVPTIYVTKDDDWEDFEEIKVKPLEGTRLEVDQEYWATRFDEDDDGDSVWVALGNYGITVGDGTTTVETVTEIEFDGATVEEDEDNPGKVIVTVDGASPGDTITYEDVTIINDNTTYTGTINYDSLAIAIINNSSLTINSGRTFIIGGGGFAIFEAPTKFKNNVWLDYSNATLGNLENDYPDNAKPVRRFTTAADFSVLTGVVPTPDTGTGEYKIWCNVGPGILVLTHQDGASTASNQIICPGSESIFMRKNDSVTVWYDPVNERWRVIQTCLCCTDDECPDEEDPSPPSAPARIIGNGAGVVPPGLVGDGIGRLIYGDGDGEISPGLVGDGVGMVEAELIITGCCPDGVPDRIWVRINPCEADAIEMRHSITYNGWVDARDDPEAPTKRFYGDCYGILNFVCQDIFPPTGWVLDIVDPDTSTTHLFVRWLTGDFTCDPICLNSADADVFTSDCCATSVSVATNDTDDCGE